MDIFRCIWRAGVMPQTFESLLHVLRDFMSIQKSYSMKRVDKHDGVQSAIEEVTRIIPNRVGVPFPALHGSTEFLLLIHRAAQLGSGLTSQYFATHSPIMWADRQEHT